MLDIATQLNNHMAPEPVKTSGDVPGGGATIFKDIAHESVLRKPREKERRIVGRLLPAHQVYFLARGPGGLVANAVRKMKPLQSVTR